MSTSCVQQALEIARKRKVAEAEARLAAAEEKRLSNIEKIKLHNIVEAEVNEVLRLPGFAKRDRCIFHGTTLIVKIEIKWYKWENMAGNTVDGWRLFVDDCVVSVDEFRARFAYQLAKVL